jgi:N-acetyl-gamma-glutamyl-phosphate reductase
MQYRIGIAGISGYGGGEALRLVAGHPQLQLLYAGGETSAGAALGSRFASLPPDLAQIKIAKIDASALPELDLLIVSLPTGKSKGLIQQLPASLKVVDIGSDHRYQDGWVYGLADVWPEKIRGKSRIANPGCYPAAALTALAPLVAQKLVQPLDPPIIIDAMSGISGAGRGGGEATLGYAEVNEDVSAYGLAGHPHVPEMTTTLKALGHPRPTIAFTPHLVPMTRGILATCYVTGDATAADCLTAARKFYADRPFVRVVDQPPHTKWATGTNLVFISYAAVANGPLIAIAAIDNLGKGAAGQAIQNANLMLGLEPTAGLSGVALWP